MTVYLAFEQMFDADDRGFRYNFVKAFANEAKAKEFMRDRWLYKVSVYIEEVQLEVEDKK